MGAMTIGPLMFAPDRLASILGMAAFLFVAEILSRRVDHRFSTWSWCALLAYIIGARLGHVVEHIDTFMVEPLRVLAVWQGGFSWPAGVIAVLATTPLFLRGARLLGWSSLPLAAGAFVSVFLLQLTAGAPPTPLPTRSFVSLDGQTIEARSLSGKPLVINLWASWCPPCRREMPMMADVARTNDNASFIFVNQGEARQVVENYFQKEGIQLDNVLLDSLGEFGRHYRTPGLPATLFIGPDGTLQSVHLGEISRENLINGVAKLAGN